MQIHPYTAGLDLNSCTIVHVEKNGLEVLSHEVPFDKPTYREGIDRIKGLYSALTNNEPPEAEPFEERECKLCPYSEERSPGRVSGRKWRGELIMLITDEGWNGGGGMRCVISKKLVLTKGRTEVFQNGHLKEVVGGE